jgi:hypothetical protein
VAATFNLGAVVATPGALDLGVDLADLLARHSRGDWGDLGAFDRKANDYALKHGERLLSAYDAPAGRVWIITESDRSSTCILLPSEY